jgi:hypothetical protein
MTSAFLRTWPRSCTSLPQEANVMLIALAVILAVAWLLGFSVFHVASAALHILIILAVIALIAHLFGARRAGP